MGDAGAGPVFGWVYMLRIAAASQIRGSCDQFLSPRISP